MATFQSQQATVGVPSTGTVNANTTLPVVTPLPTVNKTPTINEINTGRKRGMINDLAIQEATLNAVCDFMGSDLWEYSIGSGKRFNRRVELLHVAREASGYFFLNYRTLMRWIDHYQKHGEAPAITRRRNQ